MLVRVSSLARAVAPRASAATRVWAVELAAVRALPGCAVVLGGGAPVRHMGIFDRAATAMQNYREGQVAKKSKELFKAQMDYLASVPEYGMKEHVASLKDVMRLSGIDDWRKAFRTEQQQRELEEKFAEVKIADKLLPEEIEDPQLIGRRAKLRIASELGLDVSAVNRFLKSFEESKETHRWLAYRKENNLPIPESSEEYLKIMSEDRTGTRLHKIMQSQGRVRSWRSFRR